MRGKTRVARGGEISWSVAGGRVSAAQPDLAAHKSTGRVDLSWPQAADDAHGAAGDGAAAAADPPRARDPPPRGPLRAGAPPVVSPHVRPRSTRTFRTGPRSRWLRLHIYSRRISRSHQLRIHHNPSFSVHAGCSFPYPLLLLLVYHFYPSFSTQDAASAGLAELLRRLPPPRRRAGAHAALAFASRKAPSPLPDGAIPAQAPAAVDARGPATADATADRELALARGPQPTEVRDGLFVLLYLAQRSCACCPLPCPFPLCFECCLRTSPRGEPVLQSWAAVRALPNHVS